MRRPVCTATSALGLSSLSVIGGLAWGDKLLTRVDVVVARASEFASELALTGDIQAQVQTNVGFRTSGKIISRDAEIGQHVGADQVIARLDPRDQESQRSRASRPCAQLGAGTAAAGPGEFSASTRTAARGLRDLREFRPGAGSVPYGPGLGDFRRGCARGGARADRLHRTAPQREWDCRRSQCRGGPSRSIWPDRVHDRRGRPARWRVQSPRVVVRPSTADPSSDSRAHHESRAFRRKARCAEFSPTVTADTATVRVKIGLDQTPPEMTLG